MPYRLVIPGQLPGLNEYIEAERTHRQKAAGIKRSVEHKIITLAKSQLRGVRFNAPVVMHYFWIEPNRKRDKDNISFARKFIQDALVKAGILQGDGWRYIDSFHDEFDVDKANPRIVVGITDVDELCIND